MGRAPSFGTLPGCSRPLPEHSRDAPGRILGRPGVDDDDDDDDDGDGYGDDDDGDDDDDDDDDD